MRSLTPGYNTWWIVGSTPQDLDSISLSPQRPSSPRCDVRVVLSCLRQGWRKGEVRKCRLPLTDVGNVVGIGIWDLRTVGLVIMVKTKKSETLKVSLILVIYSED